MLKLEKLYKTKLVNNIIYYSTFIDYLFSFYFFKATLSLLVSLYSQQIIPYILFYLNFLFSISVRFSVFEDATARVEATQLAYKAIKRSI